MAEKVLNIIHPSTQGSLSMQTRHFNKTLSDLEDTVVLTVSVDLPLLKVSGASSKELPAMLSCSQTATIPSGKPTASWSMNGALARAVLVLDADNKVTYVSTSATSATPN